MPSATRAAAGESTANLLAGVISRALDGVEAGHCVRVNHLDEPLSRELVRLIADGRPEGLQVRILASSRTAGVPSDVSADQAVEIRNRKEGVFCLFVPAGTHDSTASSLGNSFSELNGPALTATACKEFLASPEVKSVARLVAGIQALSTTRFRPTYSELLDFALAAQARINRGEAEQAGLELWRVGLVPDGSATYADRLRLNRNAVVEISRPGRVSASLADRVAQLKLTGASGKAVIDRLRGANLQNTKAWAEGLAADRDATFDQWRPIENPPADCDRVAMIPFVDEHGGRNAKLTGLGQKSIGAPLFATIGEKQKLKVFWETEPKNTNVPRWFLEIVPTDAGGDRDGDPIELPSIEIKKGTQRTGSIPLDFGELDAADFDRYPEVCVQITAVSEDGEPLKNGADELIVARSDAFYRTKELLIVEPGQTREQHRAAGTLAEGVLKAVVSSKASLADLTGPVWTPGDRTTTFSIRATKRETIALTFSLLLDQVQARTLDLDDPLGIWSLEPGGAPVEIGHVRAASPDHAATDEERAYLAARRGFFTKVRDQKVRGRIEVGEWDPGLVDAALKHLRAWIRWLDSAAGDELALARSVDALHVHSAERSARPIDALVVLPTHPLRALWFASQATLFHRWAEVLEEIAPAERKRSVQLNLLSTITAANVPAFAHRPGAAQPYLFFRNFDAGHGVAFPAGTADPAMKLVTLGELFGIQHSVSAADGEHTRRAADAMARFHDAHPYADPFLLALVNPDDGSFATDSLAIWERGIAAEQQGQLDHSADDDPLDMPRLTITAYVDGRRTALRGLDSRRRSAEEHSTAKPSDHLQPALSIILRPIAEVEGDAAGSRQDQHHMAIVQDLSTPHPGYMGAPLASESRTSLSVFGLVVRYAGALAVDGESHVWNYWIEPNAPAIAHPVDKRLSDVMTDGVRAAGAATARLLGAESADARASLRVEMGAAEIDLLDGVHAASDWVLTVDRFIGADLFDSLDEDLHRSKRPRYLLDAAPGFQDGFGQRSMVTTSSRDEAAAILRRAAREFGFSEDDLSMGRLVETLKMVSGRLVLDALRRDVRAREVVALALAITELYRTGRLKDAIVVPVDAHSDLFQIDRGPDGDREQRCDLVLFSFTANTVEATLVEVKARHDLDDLEGLALEMAAQMDSTGAVIRERFFNDAQRVDSVLQRSLLAHALSFYLARSRRYRMIDDATASTLAKRIAQLERGSSEIAVNKHGFVIALGGASARTTVAVDDRTRIDVLTIGGGARAKPDRPKPEPAPTPPPPPVQELPAEVPATPVDSAKPPPASERSRVEGQVDALDPTPVAPSETSPSDPGHGGHAPQDVILGDDPNLQPVVWSPRVSGAPHLFILGIPGQGKSVTVERILIELAKTGTPALVLDFHGTYADPSGDYAKIAKPATLDAAKGLPFSPFEIDPRSSWMDVQLHAKGIAEVIDHVFGLGDIQKDVVFTAIRQLYRLHGFSDVPDEGELPRPPTFSEVAKALERKSAEAGVKNVIARTRSLFDFDLFKPPPAGAPVFADLLRHGVVVGLNRLGGEELALALSAFLLRSVYLAMPSWEIAKRIRLVIVLDEAHKLARDVTLPKLMKEGRKYGIAIVAASQGLADFHPDVIGNVGTKISFRINHPDSKKVAGFFQGRPGQEMSALLEHLNVGEAVTQTSGMKHAAKTRMRRADL